MRIGLASDTARAGAFTALVEPHLAGAYRFATVLLGNSGDAEDAVQDALARAWNRWDSLRDEARFPAWFSQILVNVCRDRLRRQGRVRMVDVREIPEAGVDPGPDVARRDALGRAFGHLSTDHRIVLVLRYYADLPVVAIAERLAVPEGTVKSRLHHALHELRAALDREET